MPFKPKWSNTAFVVDNDRLFVLLLHMAEKATPHYESGFTILPPFYNLEDKVPCRSDIALLHRYDDKAAKTAVQLKQVQADINYLFLGNNKIFKYRYLIAKLRDRLAQVFTLPLAPVIKAVEYELRRKSRFSSLRKMLADWNQPVEEWGVIKDLDKLYHSDIVGLASSQQGRLIMAVIDEVRDAYELINGVLGDSDLVETRDFFNKLSENLIRFIELSIDLRVQLYIHAMQERPESISLKPPKPKQ